MQTYSLSLWICCITGKRSTILNPSWAETAVGVTAAPVTVSFPEIPTPTDYSGTLNVILAAVVVAIVLALVAIVLVLRKK